MKISIEILVIIFFTGYFMIGIRQIITALHIKKEVGQRRFLKKNFSVSVIIPIREASRTTKLNLESVCKQNYPHFEVIFVAEEPNHGAYMIARTLASNYPNVRVLLSRKHDPERTIAKCHNLIFGVKHAKGEVLLFGDSDVTYSQDWIRKMTSPLKERIEGKTIEAVTSPYFIEPEGFIGKFIAQSVSLVTFTAAFTNENQKFPAYASGASIAVTKEIFEDLGIEGIWANSFNDDLVFADTVLDSGYHIYNQLENLNHPNETFSDLMQTKEKLIRWVKTISTFGHRNLRAEVPLMVGKNLQFQIALVMGIILYIIGSSWFFTLFIVIAGYIYLVVYRWAVGIIIEEKGSSDYYLLVPISMTVMMVFYGFARLFYKGFTWEGRKYTVHGRYSG